MLFPSSPCPQPLGRFPPAHARLSSVRQFKLSIGQAMDGAATDRLTPARRRRESMAAGVPRKMTNAETDTPLIARPSTLQYWKTGLYKHPTIVFASDAYMNPLVKRTPIARSSSVEWTHCEDELQR
jgi:hypothetical protein